MECYASCPATFERALADELRALGIPRVRPLKGRASFEGGARDAYRACLWSRLASRVYLVIGRFSCATDDDLYSGVYELPWSNVLKPGASIAISAHGTNNAIRNTRYASLRAKDGIADRMLADTGARPRIDTHAPDARLSLTIRGERASLALDLSGEPLFKRIPRAALACAPTGVDILRPDYAALVLAEGGWRKLCQPALPRRETKRPASAPERSENEVSAADAANAKKARPRALPYLLDIACGEGGILLEAAGMLAGRAPGAARTRWGFQAWAQHDPALWRELLAEARGCERDAAALTGHIVATDFDQRAREAAERIVRAAGLAAVVDTVEPAADKLVAALPRARANAPLAGAIVGDTTPVGENAAAAALRLATELARTPACASWRIACLARNEVPNIPGRSARGTQTLSLGNDELVLTVLGGAGETPLGGDGQRKSSDDARAAQKQDAASSPGAKHPKVNIASAGAVAATVDVGDGKPIPLIVPASEQFARRLIKVARPRRRWAKREGVTCYRVYDADLPDYSAAIDLYEGSATTPGRWLVIAEYAPPRTIDPEIAHARMLDILAIAPRVLDVPAEHVHVKTRMRSRGGSQYGRAQQTSRRTASDGERVLIEEGGLTFAVEFNDRLDTGIFLDHRLARSLVREHARKARTFLNLFAYTGTASCYAASGGAQETVTVDLSNTYLDWAEENMRLNGFTGPDHHFVRDDVLAWVERQRHTANRWDLVFCDPPTFSNSARMGERTWDVQRDHVELLRGVVDLLEPSGEAIFSCNLRGFKPDVEALARADIELEDITDATIPEDFQRNKRIHHCYLARRA